MLGLTGYTLSPEATDPAAHDAAVDREYYMIKNTIKTGGTKPPAATPAPKGTPLWTK